MENYFNGVDKLRTHHKQKLPKNWADIFCELVFISTERQQQQKRWKITIVAFYRTKLKPRYTFAVNGSAYVNCGTIYILDVAGNQKIFKCVEYSFQMFLFFIFIDQYFVEFKLMEFLD